MSILGQFQFRRDVAANWASVNPILLSGELGIEEDTDLFKIGDGVTPWNALPYGGVEGVGIQSITRTAGTGEAGTTDTYTITYTDGGTSTFQITNGSSVIVGATTIVTPAAGPSVIDADAGSNVDLRFSLPRARNISVGMTTTGAPGTSASVTPTTDANGDISLAFTIPRGEQGIQGFDGWEPVLAVVSDGERRVLRLVDWIGGGGTKPAVPTDNYIGPTGFTNLAGATDIRGATGAPGAIAEVAAGDGISVSGGTGPVATVTNADRGSVAVSDHVALPDPHTQYLKKAGDTLGQAQTRVRFGASATDTGFELGLQGNTAAGGSTFIDFHTGATAIDFDSRIGAFGGNGTSGGGTLQYEAALHNFIGTVQAPMYTSLPGTAGQKYQVGDDAFLSDRNTANALYIEGVQDANQGFIGFGQTPGTNLLGTTSTSAPLTFRGNTVWDAGNHNGGGNPHPQYQLAQADIPVVLGNATAAAETAIASFALPANFFSAANDAANVRVLFHSGATAGTHTLRVRLGPNNSNADALVATIGATASVVANSNCEAQIMVVTPTVGAAGSCTAAGFHRFTATLTGVAAAARPANTAVNTTVPLFLRISIQPSAASAAATTQGAWIQKGL